MTFQTAIAAARPGEDVPEAALMTAAIADSAELREVIALFSAQPDLEALPVIDSEGRPVGAVLERDVRRLLLNPFGHALLQNHSLYRHLDGFISAVPIADIGAGLGHFFALISEGSGHDAVILTEQGRFRGTVGGRTLLRMAAGETAPLGPVADKARAEVLKMTRTPEVRAELARSPEQLEAVRSLLQAAA